MTTRLDSLRAAEKRARAATGWDLGWIKMRPLDGPLPWDYEAIAREQLRAAHVAVDLGTGGGEVLGRIAHGARARIVATEEWHVNAPIAGIRLRPRDIDVIHGGREGSLLPLRSAALDLVLSRHEAIVPVEVDRILAPGGAFLSQQIIPDTWKELARYFPRMTVFDDHWQAYPAAFRGFGYEVRAERADYRVAFDSLEDLVAMLTVTPWCIPGFTVDRDAEALLAVERGLGGAEGIVVSDGRYLLEARKPAQP